MSKEAFGGGMPKEGPVPANQEGEGGANMPADVMSEGKDSQRSTVEF
jgi:hypothetical protein